MRRFLSIAFFLAVIACAALVYWQRHQAERAQPSADSDQGMPTPAPRLAPKPVTRDAATDVLAAAPSDEKALMQRIRENVKSNPQLAESLAREARERFGDSPESDERDALLVDSLINQQRIGAARSETYYYFDHHPGGRFAEHLFIMTGVKPRPTGPRR